MFANLRRMMVALPLAGGILLGCVSARPLAVDLNGHPRNPFAETKTATVLIFISDDCPISNRYAPELDRLQETYAPRGVHFWLVHADATESPAAIREHAKQFDLTMPELRDPGHRLVALSKADVTPSAAVFAPGMKLVYRGRIDDRAVNLGSERAHAVRHDLADALDAILAGRPVETAMTEAIGCAIPQETNENSH
jgi:hypothetical protein